MAGVLKREARLERRAKVGELYEKNWTVREIAKSLDISRQQVYDDLDLLEDAGQISRVSAKDSAKARYEAKVKACTIIKGMTDIEIAVVNGLDTIREATNMRKYLHIPVTTPVSIDARRNKLVELIFGAGYGVGDNFTDYFSKAFKDVAVLYDYYIRCSPSEVNKRHQRGYARRSFKLPDSVETLIKQGAIRKIN